MSDDYFGTRAEIIARYYAVQYELANALDERDEKESDYLRTLSELELARSENAALREALRPFADEGLNHTRYPRPERIPCVGAASYKDLYRATDLIYPEETEGHSQDTSAVRIDTIATSTKTEGTMEGHSQEPK